MRRVHFPDDLTLEQSRQNWWERLGLGFVTGGRVEEGGTVHRRFSLQPAPLPCLEEAEDSDGDSEAEEDVEEEVGDVKDGARSPDVVDTSTRGEQTGDVVAPQDGLSVQGKDHDDEEEKMEVDEGSEEGEGEKTKPVCVTPGVCNPCRGTCRSREFHVDNIRTGLQSLLTRAEIHGGLSAALARKIASLLKKQTSMRTRRREREEKSRASRPLVVYEVKRRCCRVCGLPYHNRLTHDYYWDFLQKTCTEDEMDLLRGRGKHYLEKLKVEHKDMNRRRNALYYFRRKLQSHVSRPSSSPSSSASL